MVGVRVGTLVIVGVKVGVLVSNGLAVCIEDIGTHAASINIIKAITQRTFFILPPEGFSTLYYTSIKSSIGEYNATTSAFFNIDVSFHMLFAGLGARRIDPGLCAFISKSKER